MVVCPIYQLPARSSQIYQQAIARNVCIFSYAHLAVMVRFCDETNAPLAQSLLLTALRSTEGLNPTKDSVAYWSCLNRSMLTFHEAIRELWRVERVATIEGMTVVKGEALDYLTRERRRIMEMSREEDITHLIRDMNIEGRERIIRAVSDKGILSMT